MTRCSCRGGGLRRHGRRPARRLPLNWRLTLQKPVTTDDGAGGEMMAWRDHATVYAALIPLCARDVLFAGMESGEVLWEVRLRWRDDVQAGDRFLRRDGALLLVQAVFDPDGRRRFLICRCLERPQ
ncbi:phage head closure protein [Thermopetrobacter sp. TC1]|uniref:phage head closure protein n=1 Tax=Thermopetrobacter sp. TC1 TaxID=1495045 RepID=UPI00056DB47C|nr:phage head closure protein [Thermopetrobacter sp. TC1]